MDKKQFPQSQMRVISVIFPILSIIIAVSYFLAMQNGFNYQIGHFDNTAWFVILSVTVGISFVAAIISSILNKGRLVDIPSHPSFVGMFFRIVAMVIAFYISGKFIGALIAHSSFTKVELIAGFMFMALPFAIILSLSEKIFVTPYSSILWILATLSVNLMIFARYFDQTLPINSAVRHFATIIQCAILLFMVSECRFTFDRDYKIQKAPFAFFSCALCTSCSLGLSLGAFIFRLIENDPRDPSLPIEWLILYIFISLAAAERLFTLKKSEK